MDKAIKQRLLGGLVLVAGAALFLPILLDGEGAPLTVPPMPAAPVAPKVEQVAPALDKEVSEADASVQAAQESSTFEDPAASSEQEVAPDAAAMATPEPVVSPAAVKALAAAPTVSTTPAVDKAGADKLAADKAQAERLAAQKVLEQAKEKEKADKARQAVEAKAAVEKTAAKLASEKAAAEKSAAEKLASEKALAAKKTAESKAAPLPEAWVVQVASLSTKDKADVLVQKLRQKNYRATAHQQGGVWKVTVGPELRREMADSIKARVAADADLKLSGFVLPYKP